jgi:hypothetical protein
MTPSTLPRLRDDDAVAPTPLRLVLGGAATAHEEEERRLTALATDLLRELLDRGAPRVEIVAHYLGVRADEVPCLSEGVYPMTPALRRNLARVTLAFAPGALRHTARRLLDGERAGRSAS